MADLKTLIQNAERDGYFREVATNQAAQFGMRNRRYIGAELLPERMKMERAYREDAVKFRSVIANAGSRYSPVQKKDGDLFASFLVELGQSSIGREMTPAQWDALMMLMTDDEAAMLNMADWADITLNVALKEFNERQRWQAIVNASVVRLGDNGYAETVPYANPAGHRFNAGGQWSNPAYDPFTDILAGKDLLESKGYKVSRIVTGTPVRSLLLRNPNTKEAVIGRSDATGLTSIPALDSYMESNELQQIETYNLQYRSSNGTGFFLARNVFCMFATTGQDETLDTGDAERFLSDTLGYTAIGRVVGEAEPGTSIGVYPQERYPKRVEGEGVQESLPVITEPEAMVIIGGIS